MKVNKQLLGIRVMRQYVVERCDQDWSKILLTAAKNTEMVSLNSNAELYWTALRRTTESSLPE
jgi:hypothetical protein